MATLEDLPDKLLNHIGSKVSIRDHLRLGAALGYTEGKPVRLGAAELSRLKTKCMNHYTLSGSGSTRLILSYGE